MSQTHPFLEQLLVLERRARDDGLGLQAFDNFVHTPGVAEQLLRLIESGNEFEAQSSSRLLRFLRPCPARTVILRRVAALPPLRRVRLADMLLDDEREVHGEALADARDSLRTRNDRLLSLIGDKEWLATRGPHPLSRLSPSGLDSIDEARREAEVGVVTAFAPLLPLRLRKPTRARLHELLGRQPGEPAARALKRELAKTSHPEETQRLRREVMRQASLPRPDVDGRHALEVWPSSHGVVNFRLVHTPSSQPPVILEGMVTERGVVTSLRADDRIQPPITFLGDGNETLFPADTASFLGLLQRAGPASTHANEVLLERCLGLPERPFVLPRPAGRLDTAQLRRLWDAGLLSPPPGRIRLPDFATRADWRKPSSRKDLVEWLRSGAMVATLAGRPDEAAPMRAEAAFVSNGRRSDVYAFAAAAYRAYRGLDVGPRLVPDPS